MKSLRRRTLGSLAMVTQDNQSARLMPLALLPRIFRFARTSVPSALVFLLSSLLLAACGNADLDGQTTTTDRVAQTNAPVPEDTSGPAFAKTNGDTPAVVVAAFAAKYPGVTLKKWNRDRNESYEAHFDESGQTLRADFTPAGVWIETERSLKWDDLPKPVQEAIKSEFNKDDIVELEFTQNAERGDFYDVEIDPKGDKKFDVEYRADGRKV